MLITALGLLHFKVSRIQSLDLTNKKFKRELYGFHSSNIFILKSNFYHKKDYHFKEAIDQILTNYYQLFLLNQYWLQSQQAKSL